MYIRRLLLYLGSVLEITQSIHKYKLVCKRDNYNIEGIILDVEICPKSLLYTTRYIGVTLDILPDVFIALTWIMLARRLKLEEN